MILNNKNLYFVDYDNSSGNGHLERCLKFSQIFDNSFKNIFLTKKKIKFTKKNCININKLDSKTFFKYLIIDSYKINKKLFKKLKKRSQYTININDNYNKALKTDFFINYSDEEKNKKFNIINKKSLKFKLLGKKYNFIYPNLKLKEKEKKTFNIFIYLGTLIQKKIITKIIKNLTNLKKKFNILIISSSKIKSIKNIKIRTKQSVKKREFLNEICNSDIVICSTGVTVFEAVSAKKIVFGVPISKNQLNNFNELKKLKLIDSLKNFPKLMNKKDFLQKKNEYLKCNHYLRNYNHLFNIKQKIFPIKNKFKETFQIEEFNHKNKNIVHLFNLQTIENRKYFFNNKRFSLEAHKDYINDFLANSFNLIFFIKFKRENIGYIKLNKINNYYDCSIIIDKNFRNRGFSTAALKYIKDNENFFSYKIKARIISKNRNSIKSFENAGFKKNKDLFVINGK